MKLNVAYLQTADGKKHFDNVRVFDEIFEDIHIVSVSGECDSVLDGELAASFVFEPQNIESYVSDYRYKEFWCRPFFGNFLKELPKTGP